MNYESDNLDNEQIEMSPSSSKQEGNIIKSYLNIAKRKILLIIIFSILGFIPAFLLSKRDPVTYVGEFQLLLEPVSTEEKLTDASTLTRTRGSFDNDLLNLDYPTILRILTSSLVLSQVADKIHTKYPDLPQEFILRKLQKKLDIERIKSGKSRFDTTKIIQVKFEETDPQMIDIILENTAETFLEYSTKEREKTLSYGVAFIDEQIPKIQKEIKRVQQKQKQLQLKYKMVNPQSQGSALFENKISTENNLEKTIRELEEVKILASKLQKDLGISAEESLLASSFNEDPERLLLIKEIKKIEAEIASQSAIFTNEFPQIQELKEKLANLEKLLAQKNQEIIADKNVDIDQLNPNILNYQDRNRFNLIRKLIETQNQIDILSIRYELLLDLKKEIDRKLAIMPDVVEEYNELERQLNLNNNLLNQLSAQKETLNVEAAQKKNPWQLISQPKVPRDENNQPIGYASDPKKKLIAGLGAGFMLGCLIAVLLEKKANVFYEVSDLEYNFGKPILGEIRLNKVVDNDQEKEIINKGNKFLNNIVTNIDNDSNNTEKLNTITLNEPNISQIKEKDFDELAVNLHFKLSQNSSHSHSILISSLSPKDNQALVAVNLAKTISQLEKQILLVNINFKESEIKSLLTDENELILNQSWKNYKQKNPIIRPFKDCPNLAILTIKNSDIKNLKNFISKGIFDLVIYNSSFFLDNYELSLLAEKTEGIVMVTKTKSTPFSSLQTAVKRIQEYNLNLLGFVVMNEENKNSKFSHLLPYL